jgi:hypothetical protein
MARRQKKQSGIEKILGAPGFFGLAGKPGRAIRSKSSALPMQSLRAFHYYPWRGPGAYCRLLVAYKF